MNKIKRKRKVIPFGAAQGGWIEGRCIGRCLPGGVGCYYKYSYAWQDADCISVYTTVATCDGVRHTHRCRKAGGGCFLAGVMVNTRNGLMPIEQLKVGDEVLGFQDGKLQYCTVSHIYRSYQPYYFIINGSIKVTGSHPFWVDGGWIQAEYIELGDILLSKDLKPVVVQSKIQVNEPVEVFNIEVDNAHTFFVQGILVHNKKKPDE